MDISILKNLNLLYVEDDLMLRRNYSAIFNNFFLKVYEASDGFEALAIFEKEHIHVVATDIKMPKMSGLEFAHKIRKLSKNIPIFITTAYSEKDELIDAIKLNLVDYILKPLSYEALKKVLNDTIVKMSENNLLEIIIDSNSRYSPFTKIFTTDGVSSSLTNKESKLFELFLDNRNKILSKSIIEYEVYENEYMSDVALKMLLSKLRKKLQKPYIKTLKQSGYIFQS